MTVTSAKDTRRYRHCCLCTRVTYTWTVQRGKGKSMRRRLSGTGVFFKNCFIVDKSYYNYAVAYVIIVIVRTEMSYDCEKRMDFGHGIDSSALVIERSKYILCIIHTELFSFFVRLSVPPVVFENIAMSETDRVSYARARRKKLFTKTVLLSCYDG